MLAQVISTLKYSSCNPRGASPLLTPPYTVPSFVSKNEKELFTPLTDPPNFPARGYRAHYNSSYTADPTCLPRTQIFQQKEKEQCGLLFIDSNLFDLPPGFQQATRKTVYTSLHRPKPVGSHPDLIRRREQRWQT